MAVLLSPRYRTASILLWISFFVIMFGFYFANSWTPRLLVESGMTEQQGIIGGLMLTMGGTFGSLLYGGVLTTRWDARLTLMVFTVLSAVTLVLFITTSPLPLLAFSSGVVVGMLVNGCIAGLYTVAPMTYEPGVRTTGVGWGGLVSAGPVPSSLPLRSARCLTTDGTPHQLYIGVAVVVLLAAVALFRLRPYEEIASSATNQPASRATTG